MRRFSRTLTVPINRNTSQIIKGTKPNQTKNTSKGLFQQKYLGKPCPRRSRKFLSADLHIQMIYWLKISFLKKNPVVHTRGTTEIPCCWDMWKATLIRQED